MFSVVQFTCAYTFYVLNINKLGIVEVTWITAHTPAGHTVHKHTTGSKLRCQTPTKHTTK